MPYTISHAAAALPVHAVFRRLPLAALMIGSMAPDFAYFLPLEIGRMDTHSVRGVFLWALPMGFAVWLYFVAVLERPTIAFLPDAWRTRITPSAPLSWRSMLVATLAVIIGAFTHLIWDSFTHSSTFVSEALPDIYEEVFYMGGRRIRLYFVLQILSSVLGLAVLAIWAWRIRHRPPAPSHVVVAKLTPRVTVSEQLLALLFIGAMALVVGSFSIFRLGYAVSIRESVFLMLIGGMIGAMLGWTEVALAVRLRSRLEKLLAPR